MNIVVELHIVLIYMKCTSKKGLVSVLPFSNWTSVMKSHRRPLQLDGRNLQFLYKKQQQYVVST